MHRSSFRFHIPLDFVLPYKYCAHAEAVNRTSRIEPGSGGWGLMFWLAELLSSTPHHPPPRQNVFTEVGSLSNQRTTVPRSSDEKVE
ncbi:hypothetical protein T11_17553 [Trichinella zimbabwensis]|uniref:Uncharacterized protein n=1 Tax=Trichinella zimbabwensis TaxID=268475 RepID=A0A0V1HAX8_9BILA|nr:hypothetical protein T11_17553 [Trichinella zimbabwensis]